MSTQLGLMEDIKGLPEELQVAQKAIHTPEVQEILKRLSKYNLGVYMPHLHKVGEGFYVLPDDMMAVEENMATKFVTQEEAAADPHRLPTAWRWINNKATVAVAGKCQWMNCY